MALVHRVDAGSLEMDGSDVSLSIPFDVPPSPAPETVYSTSDDDVMMEELANALHQLAPIRQPSATSSMRFVPQSAFLYIERRPPRLYQYHSQPSPGDLRRIENGRLRVISFTPNGLVEFQSDGETRPVEDFGCNSKCSPRSKTSSTATATRRVGSKSARRRGSTPTTSSPRSTASDSPEPSHGAMDDSEASS